ncbi:MAG: hypothetical protein SGI72_10115 [Planctomycetota bacterium]|nr:hypothetical protein [Planctomycetota bacterium]
MKQHKTRLDSTLRGMIRAASLVTCSAFAFAGPGSGSSVRFNEIDVHKVGIDTLEFIELQGAPNASLAGHMLLVVDGDSVNAGVLDRAIDLGAFTASTSGFFVLGDTALFPKNFDLGPYDQIENGTTTFYLVTTSNQATINALVGTRVTSGATTTLISSLATIVDRIAIADASYPLLDVVYDGATVVGPDGNFLPAGITRCSNAPFGWSATYNDYDSLVPTAAAPTPGAANPACDPGVGFCYGDGSGTACPCGNSSAVGANEGCLAPFGFGAKLRASGTASLANDTMVLIGSQMPDGPVLYFQGTTRQSAGAGIVFGDGLYCAGGTVTRLGLKFNSGGTSTLPGVGEPSISTQASIATPGLRTYQGWYRSVAPFCTPATFNTTHGLEVQWVP